MTAFINALNRLWSIPSITVAVLVGISPAEAQVPVSDSTTGTSINAIVPGFEFEITGGIAAGSNLFHSFDQFSIPSLGSATFINDVAAIQNVIGRVTGANPSIINGLLTTGGLSPDFNLFLINPNGIVFGPGGALDIGGSFIASTGHAVQFGSEGIFNASPTTSSDLNLLTIAPSAILFNQINAAQPLNAIEVNGSTLSVPTQQSLVLLGGNSAPDATATDGVLINGAILDAQSGRVELGSGGGEGTVSLGDNFKLSFLPNMPKADITLQGSLVDVSDLFGGPGRGHAQLQGRSITLTDSAVFAENYSGLQGSGSIVIRAEQLISDNSAVQAITHSSAAGGNVALDLSHGVGRLRLLNNAVLSAETDNVGAGGNLTIQANEIEVFSGSGLGVETRGDGDAGAVSINTQTLRLEDGFISGNTFGRGQSGQIQINAANRIDLLGLSEIAANADDLNPVTGMFVSNVGAAGGLDLTTNQLSLQGGSKITASTFGDAGAGGQIQIQANTVSLSGSGTRIASQVDFGSPSNGGNIEIVADVLRLQDGAQISTSTLDSFDLGTSGDSGAITIRDANLVEITANEAPTGLFAAVGPGSTGAGGTIRVNVATLQLAGDSATISSSTNGSGPGGNITINGELLQVREGAQIQAATAGFAQGGRIQVTENAVELLGTAANPPFFPSALVTSTLGSAPAGDILVTTNTLSVEAGARISASSDGIGSGGSIILSAAEQTLLAGAGPDNIASGLYVEGRDTGPAGNVQATTPFLRLDQGQIVASTVSDDGGDILLQIPQALLMQDQALISATAGAGSGDGNGGNIDIDTGYLITVPFSDSDIVANAFLGRGGNIQISAQGILNIGPQPAASGNGTNDIDASSAFGTDGTVTILQPTSDPNEGLDASPPAFVDVSRLIAQGCQSGHGIASSRLTLAGRGGVAMDPSAVPSYSATFTDLGRPEIANTAISPFAQPTPGPVNPSSQAISHASPSRVTEAQGWQVNAQGEVVLIAQTESVIPQGSWDVSYSCSLLRQ